jgi:phosphohistidine phosphatase
VQILLVSSSANRHWLVPKGIVEPGLSAEESAIKESLEEAGVLKGKITGAELGRYSYNKWGGRCEVQVFALKVEKLIADKQWGSAQRERKWVPSSKIAGYLKQPELADLALELARQLNP